MSAFSKSTAIDSGAESFIERFLEAPIALQQARKDGPAQAGASLSCDWPMWLKTPW